MPLPKAGLEVHCTDSAIPRPLPVWKPKPKVRTLQPLAQDKGVAHKLHMGHGMQPAAEHNAEEVPHRNHQYAIYGGAQLTALQTMCHA